MSLKQKVLEPFNADYVEVLRLLFQWQQESVKWTFKRARIATNIIVFLKCEKNNKKCNFFPRRLPECISAHDAALMLWDLTYYVSLVPTYIEPQSYHAPHKCHGSCKRTTLSTYRNNIFFAIVVMAFFKPVNSSRFLGDLTRDKQIISKLV